MVNHAKNGQRCIATRTLQDPSLTGQKVLPKQIGTINYEILEDANNKHQLYVRWSEEQAFYVRPDEIELL